MRGEKPPPGGGDLAAQLRSTRAGAGDPPQQARRRADQLVERVQVPNRGYRTDIAECEWRYLGPPGA